ncbi:ABC transporter substrate-binding protein [Mycobacterium sp. CVI_P3]|uniref:ABC transporter substrate-binding protein n=1 Tax=Mycobacterium pinniadriaticum TaxID=2994102 RepID=A0ABT3S7J5_9MYCO|nr:ABC transporter substrate-binding protein [Mycobacterium pinniadriaticum]MCX2928667.1 ABC transporter substrate-binding protein [Mycobacterium pinniadriaticum]MCX2935466.1 ABC transporter substrate-binding protein [Mycobacterium pinniadriaticum]
MKITSGIAPLAIIALLLSGTACSGKTNNANDNATVASTVRTPLMSDPPPLDPDTFYQPEGLLIMTSAYQGLLQYAPGSTKLEGLLATKWDVSPDGLTYTFTLRDGVKFADGTPFDSAAAKASFQRRTDMAGGPAYMLADVKDMQTPDPQTFVVTLTKPVAPFLDYLASPYGPLMTSPTAVAEHANGNDHASAWLASHTAGTGPYELTDAVPASHYTMTANKNYWGEAPQITSVQMPVIAATAVQRLELGNGQLDMVLHGFSKGDYEALAAGPDTEVLQENALVKAMVMINPSSPVFGPHDARAALSAGLDQTALTTQVFGAQGAPSTQFYPIGMMPDGAVPDKHDYDPAKLAELGRAGGDVEIGFPTGDSSLQDLANQIQVILQQAGLTATVRDFPLAQFFALIENPDQRPDLLLASFNPDAAHPDTWSRIYNYTDAPVNLQGCSVPEADKLLDAGSAEPDPAKSQALYVEAAKAYRDSLCWVNLSDLHNSIAARKGYSGWRSQPAWMWDTDFSTLKYQG